MKQKGYSIIELMIVVGIIGVLTLIAYPSYQNYMIKVKITEAVSVGSSIARNVFETMVSGGYDDNGYSTQNAILRRDFGIPFCDFSMSHIDYTGDRGFSGGAKNSKDVGIPHAKACYWDGLIVVLNKDEFPFKTHKAISFHIQPGKADREDYTWNDMITCGQKGFPIFGKNINLPRKYLPLGCRDYAAIRKDGALDWPEDF